MKKDVFHASGKRKSAIVRATLKPGKGIIRINKIRLANIQPKLVRVKVIEVLALAGDIKDKVDINISVKGGGIMSQAAAISLAIGRVLSEAFPDIKDDLLKYDRQLLVADVRRKETHKPNRHGKARSKRQKSYR